MSVDSTRSPLFSRMPQSLRLFDYVRSLVHQHAAIVLDETKDYLIEARLQPLCAELGFDSVVLLIESLRARTPGPLHSRVVEALTTNETSFFRDLHPFQLLTNHVVPELLSRNAESRSLKIWSAACSTGQEPYSIAISLLENFPQLRNWDVQIVATDLNEVVLDRAQAGIYRQLEVNRGLPAKYLVRYFKREGSDWRVRADVQKLCEFRRLNLISPWPQLPRFDIVFLRNVLIYFDIGSKREVLCRLPKVMNPRAYLFLGGAETTVNLSEEFDRAVEGAGGCFQLNARKP